MLIQIQNHETAYINFIETSVHFMEHRHNIQTWSLRNSRVISYTTLVKDFIEKICLDGVVVVLVCCRNLSKGSTVSTREGKKP